MEPRAPAQKESIVGLARQLIGAVVGLARLEVKHGRAEMGEKVSRLPGVAIRVGVGIAFLFLFLISFVVFVVLGIAALTNLPGWLIALVLVFVFAFIGLLFVWLGVKRLPTDPMPSETIASVKEDISWVKRLLRRD